MVSKFEVFAVVSVTGLILANATFAQERGGVPVPERPSEYQLPPSTGGGGGRPGLLVGTGADVQFGGPRYDFTLPTPQSLYRADNQIDGAEDPIEIPRNDSSDEQGAGMRPDGPPGGSHEWLAYLGIDDDELLAPLDEGRAQVPPSTGGGGGRPAANTEMNDDLDVVPEEFGYDYYDPPDYIEDCGHPWHGECGPSPTWPKPFTPEELRRINQHAAGQAVAPGSGEGEQGESSSAPVPYDTPSFDGFRPDLGFTPTDNVDW